MQAQFKQSIADSHFWTDPEKKGDAHDHVECVEFCIMSGNDIRRRSVCEITTATLDEKGGPKHGGLLDLRMGPVERNLVCKTCLKDCLDCSSHPGHMELPMPVLNISFIRLILSALRSICFSCVGLRDYNDVVQAMIEKYQSARFWTQKKQLSEVSGYLRRKTVCQQCKAPCPTIVASGLTIYWSWSGKHVLELYTRVKEYETSKEEALAAGEVPPRPVFVPEGITLPTQAMVEANDFSHKKLSTQKLPMDNTFIEETLRSLDNEDMRLLGLDPVRSNPANAVMHVL